MTSKIVYIIFSAATLLLFACRQQTATREVTGATAIPAEGNVNAAATVEKTAATVPAMETTPAAPSKKATAGTATHKHETVPAPAGFANEIDPICNMKVRSDYTDTCHYQGKVYAFCSAYCKEEFQASPESFLKNDKARQ